MNCPKCSYPNKDGVTYCSMCYEVFNRSAADRYMHAQKRARMQREGTVSQPTTPVEINEKGVLESGHILSEKEREPLIKWAPMRDTLLRGFAAMRRWALAYRKEIGIATAIIVIGVVAIFFTSPAQRLNIFGHRLDYHYPPKTSTGYLISHRSVMKSWSERGGRLDTPLERWTMDEAGNVDLRTAAYENKALRARFSPREWIVSREGSLVQNIPLNHPSLKSSVVTFNRQGRLLSREANLSTRMGRAIPFIVPQWPLKAQRPGDRWSEPVQWVEAIGDWRFVWKGRIQWEVAGMETRETHLCMHLLYQAQVTPSLAGVPEWAAGAVGSMSFRGSSSGDAYFDTERRQVLWNDFHQEGTFSIPINDIYRIPENLRVGRTPRRRWGQRLAPEPGVLVIEINNIFGIRRS